MAVAAQVDWDYKFEHGKYVGLTVRQVYELDKDELVNCWLHGYTFTDAIESQLVRYLVLEVWGK